MAKHIGDGSVPVNIRKPGAMEKAEFFSMTKAVDIDLFDLVRARSGRHQRAQHGTTAPPTRAASIADDHQGACAELTLALANDPRR